MTNLLVSLGVMIYLCLGIIVIFTIDECPDLAEVIIGTVFWPILVLFLVVFGIGHLMVKIGTWLHDILFNKI